MYSYQSDSVVNIIPALLKAQTKLDIAEKSRKSGGGGRSWKYADWATIVDASRKPLVDNKLCISQRIKILEGQMVLATTLFHESGEWLESLMPLWVANTASAQDIGSRLTYFKRYAYVAIIGLVTDDEDDDGARDRMINQEYHTSPKPQAAQKITSPAALTEKQLGVLEYELRGEDSMLDSLFAKFEISSLKDFPPSMYDATITRIREIKRNRETK